MIGISIQVGGGGSPSFVTLPEETPPPETSYYLQLDTVDDNLKTPTITFDEVIMDFVNSAPSGSNAYYIDSRAGASNAYVYNFSGGTDTTSASSPFDVYINGVLNNGNTITDMQIPVARVTFRWYRKTEGFTATDDVNLFSQSTNSGRKAAQVYDVKFLLNGVLVAHYDMTKGNAQDQVGTNHAILTGGTFVQV